MTGARTNHDERRAWLEPPASGARTRLLLFCLPYAGGGAWIFREWKRVVPWAVDVCPLHLPGRGRRMQEPPLTRVADIARQVADALRPYIDRPYALFGHSTGGLLAFEIARELRRGGARPPERLLVSASVAPHLLGNLKPVHQLPDDQFLDVVRAMNGTPDDVLANDELMRLALPGLRADFEAMATYRLQSEAALDVPIVAFAGTRDQLVRPPVVEAWREHTATTFTMQAVPGDHFYVVSNKAVFLPILFEALQDVVAGLPTVESDERVGL